MPGYSLSFRYISPKDDVTREIDVVYEVDRYEVDENGNLHLIKDNDYKASYAFGTWTIIHKKE